MTPATSRVVADTHVLVWYLTDSAKLSAAAHQALETSVAAEHPILVSSISLVEIVYAAEKAKNPLTEQQRDYVFEVLEQDDSPFLIVAVTPAIGRAMATIDRQSLPDPGDRTIVATAIAMDAAAVSADDRLRTAGEQRVLTAIW